MKNSKKQRSSQNDSDLDEMREAFRRHNERKTSGGGGKSDWDKLEPGKNLRRFLPRPGHRKFYTEGWTHFGVGPNEKAVRCIDEEHIDPEKGLPVSGTKCPRCKRFLREQARINSEYDKGDKDGQAEWKRAKEKYVPRHQYYSNTLRKGDDGDYEVKITNYGVQLWGQLMNFFLGNDTDVGDFTHPESGRWINIKKEKKSATNRRSVEYQAYAVEGPDISDAWETIKDQLHDLEAAVGKVLSAEEFIAIEKGINVDKDSREDDSESGEEKRRGYRDDDDDDDDDDNDDDDDDDRPVKIKKSNLAKKRDRS